MPRGVRQEPAVATGRAAADTGRRRGTSLRDGSWVVASRIVPQIGGVLLLVIGGRFLDPAALGSFVLVFAGVELLRKFVRAGWREAVLIDADGTATPVVTTLSLIGGVVTLAVTLLAAAVVQRWTALDPVVPRCIALLGATLPPLALSVIWEGLLLRRERTAAAAKPLIVAEIAHVALAFLLLASGHGILALAWARIARAVVLTVGLGHAARWPLSLSADWRRAAGVLPVSANVTLSSLIGFATTSGADLFVGLFLGPASVAFYRVGSRVAGAVAEAVGETVRVLAWSSLAAETRHAADDAAVARSVAAFFDRMLVLVVPVFIGLALVSEPLIRLMMGDTWRLAGQIVALRALAALLLAPSTVAWPALAIVGKSRYLPVLTAIVAGSATLLLVVVAPLGLMAVAWSQVAAALLGCLATLAVVNRLAFAHFPLWPRADILLGIVALAAAVVAVRHATASVALPVALALQIAAGALVWLGFLRLRRPLLLADLVQGSRDR